MELAQSKIRTFSKIMLWFLPSKRCIFPNLSRFEIQSVDAQTSAYHLQSSTISASPFNPGLDCWNFRGFSLHPRYFQLFCRRALLLQDLGFQILHFAGGELTPNSNSSEKCHKVFYFLTPSVGQFLRCLLCILSAALCLTSAFAIPPVGWIVNLSLNFQKHKIHCLWCFNCLFEWLGLQCQDPLLIDLHCQFAQTLRNMRNHPKSLKSS